MQCTFYWVSSQLRPLHRVLLAVVLLFCLSVARVQSQPALGAPDVTTTQLAGGALLESQSWTFLFKLCIGAGSHDVAVTYLFPASSASSLSFPYNLTEHKAPWIMLYPESNWQDSYFYIVSVLIHAVFLTAAACLTLCCRAIATAA
jgi:hypothetical protein